MLIEKMTTAVQNKPLFRFRNKVHFPLTFRTVQRKIAACIRPSAVFWHSGCPALRNPPSGSRQRPEDKTLEAPKPMKRLSRFVLLFLACAVSLAVQENVYFGTLHSRTSYSDGSGKPTQAYNHARDVAHVDLLAITEHNHAQAKQGAAADRQDSIFIAKGPFPLLRGCLHVLDSAAQAQTKTAPSWPYTVRNFLASVLGTTKTSLRYPTSLPFLMEPSINW
jgi:hypothetical protein